MIDGVFSFGTLLAQAAPGPATAPAGPGSMWPMLITFGPLILLFWLLILRPQQKERRERQNMIDAIAKGDQIVTHGGLHGTVEAVDVQKQILSVTIAPKTTVRVSKTGVAFVKTKAKSGKGAKDESPAEDQKAEA
jgi:preprotein translocase subunit YajC